MRKRIPLTTCRGGSILRLTKMKKRKLRMAVGLVATSLMVGGTTTYLEASAKNISADVKTSMETGAGEKGETYVKGSAILSDYGYVFGKLNEEGWENEFLDMKYEPEDSLEMGLKQNKKIADYYARNGADKQIASSEMVVLGENGTYMQLMSEVNPNNETDEEILDRFADDEELETLTKVRTRKIAGKKFLVRRGVLDGERYMIGVSTETDNIVTAFKMKYTDKTSRKLFLEGFSDMEKDTKKDLLSVNGVRQH